MAVPQKIQQKHMCHFLDIKRIGVTCMAYNESKMMLCVGRSNGSLEFYHADEEILVLISATVPIAAWRPHRILWFNDRLFTASHNSDIIEWDLQLLIPKKIATPTYCGACCDFVLHPTQPIVAISGENDSARILAIDEDDGSFSLHSAVYCAKDSKPLSLLFSSKLDNGALLFIGTSTGIVTCHIWNTKTVKWTAEIRYVHDHAHGHHYSTKQKKKPKKSLFSSPEEEAKKEDLPLLEKAPLLSSNEFQMIWCIAQLNFQSIMVGTSGGSVQILDYQTGIVLTTIAALNADVLCICPMEDSNQVFVSGVDNRLVRLTKQEAYKTVSGESWAITYRATVNNADVLAMSVIGKKEKKSIVTGGLDGQLLLSRNTSNADPNQFLPTFYHFFQFQKVYSCHLPFIVPSRDLLLQQFGKKLIGWSIPLQGDERSIRPVCLFQYKIKSKFNIACSALSTNGSIVAFSSPIHTGLLSLSYTQPAEAAARHQAVNEDDEPPCKRSHFPELSASVKQHPQHSLLAAVGNARLLLFSIAKNENEDSSLLFVIDTNSSFCVLDLVHSKCRKLIPQGFKENAATIMCVSKDSRYVCLGNSQGHFVCYDIAAVDDDDEKILLHGILPLSGFICTDATFFGEGENLSILIVGAKKRFNGLMIYNMSAKTSQCFYGDESSRFICEANSLTHSLLPQSYQLCKRHPLNDDLVVVASCNNAFLLNIFELLNHQKEKKIYHKFQTIASQMFAFGLLSDGSAFVGPDDKKGLDAVPNALFRKVYRT